MHIWHIFMHRNWSIANNNLFIIIMTSVIKITKNAENFCSFYINIVRKMKLYPSDTNRIIKNFQIFMHDEQAQCMMKYVYLTKRYTRQETVMILIVFLFFFYKKMYSKIYSNGTISIDTCMCVCNIIRLNGMQL